MGTEVFHQLIALNENQLYWKGEVPPNVTVTEPVPLAHVGQEAGVLEVDIPKKGLGLVTIPAVRVKEQPDPSVTVTV